MKTTLQFFLSHALFAIVAFILARLTSTFIPILFALPFKNRKTNKKGTNVLFGSMMILGYFIYIALLFAHLEIFCEIFSREKAVILYLIVFLSVIAGIGIMIYSQHMNINEFSLFSDENKWIDYIIPFVIFFAMAFLPVIYNNGVISVFPLLYMKLPAYFIISLLKTISGLSLFIGYFIAVMYIIIDINARK